MTTSWSTDHSLSSYSSRELMTSLSKWWGRWCKAGLGVSMLSTRRKSLRMQSIKLPNSSTVFLLFRQALVAELISSLLRTLSCWLSWTASLRWIGKRPTRWQAEAIVLKERRLLTSCSFHRKINPTKGLIWIPSSTSTQKKAPLTVLKCLRHSAKTSTGWKKLSRSGSSLRWQRTMPGPKVLAPSKMLKSLHG